MVPVEAITPAVANTEEEGCDRSANFAELVIRQVGNPWEEFKSTESEL